jgi:hypothetical protein
MHGDAESAAVAETLKRRHPPPVSVQNSDKFQSTPASNMVRFPSLSGLWVHRLMQAKKRFAAHFFRDRSCVQTTELPEVLAPESQGLQCENMQAVSPQTLSLLGENSRQNHLAAGDEHRRLSRLQSSRQPWRDIFVDGNSESWWPASETWSATPG